MGLTEQAYLCYIERLRGGASIQAIGTTPLSILKKYFLSDKHFRYTIGQIQTLIDL